MSDVPPGSGTSFGSDVPPPGPESEAIKNRVRPPAIFLLVVNALNLVFGGLFLIMAFTLKSDPARFEDVGTQVLAGLSEEQRAEAAQEGYTPLKIVQLYGNMFLWGGGLSVIVGVLGVLGGIRMMSLRSYGLGVTSSVLTAIPCVTPCCLIGQIAGIWALIVLLNKDVRSAFH